MASIPDEAPAVSFDASASTADSSPPASWFWRYFWLMTLGAGLLGFSLVAMLPQNDIGGLLLLLSIALFVFGLIPCLVGTAEGLVGYALSQRLPDYQHRWSPAARGWFVTHWLMLLAIVVVVVVATQALPRQGKDILIVLATLLSCIYVIILCFVLAWRWRRKRLAALTGLEELQAFELLLENEDAFHDVALVLPIFDGKQKGRCPVLMRGTLGDWPVLLFDWLDINKQPARREWITAVLIRLQHPVPMVFLQPHERVVNTQLHWWHIFLEFPFGLIIFLVSAASHFASQLKNKASLMIHHTPALTKGYQLDSAHFPELQKHLSPPVCQDIIALVHKKKRFMMVHHDWLLLASHKKEIPPNKMGELVADALRLADVLEQAKP